MAEKNNHEENLSEEPPMEPINITGHQTILMAEKHNNEEDLHCFRLETPMEPYITGFGYSMRGKRSWPEVVGLTAEEAKRKIKEDMAEAQIQVVPHDAIVTFDYQSNRVQIFVDPSGKVTTTPGVG